MQSPVWHPSMRRLPCFQAWVRAVHTPTSARQWAGGPSTRTGPAPARLPASPCLQVEPPGRGDALRHLRMEDGTGTSLWWRTYVRPATTRPHRPACAYDYYY